MLATMQDLLGQGDLRSRLLACQIAKDAAPYVHPRLAAMQAAVTLNPLQELFDYVAAQGHGLPVKP
jgi:hypothetical protein